MSWNLANNVMAAVKASWGMDTCDSWNCLDPPNHQCGVSSLVIQDYLGGDIAQNFILGEWVFFNKLPDKGDVFIRPEWAAAKRKYPSDRLRTREQVLEHALEKHYTIMAARMRMLLGLPDA